MRYRYIIQRFLIAAFWIMTVSFIMISPSCVKKQPYTLRDHAVSLYNESCKLLSIYIDSMAHAGDSAKLEAIGARFEDKLAKLNFKYPANTDLDITEDENDTLIMLTNEYVAVRDSMLYRFAHPLLLRPDSVASDSAMKAETTGKRHISNPQKPLKSIQKENEKDF